MSKKCGNCKHCEAVRLCGEDYRCKAKSDADSDFYVSSDDDINFHGDGGNEPCKDYRFSAFGEA